MVGIGDANALAAEGFGDRGVIQVGQLRRLVAAAEHGVLQGLDIARRGIVNDDHGQRHFQARRGFQIA